MDINKITLKNPINHQEVDSLVIKILNGKQQDYLIINFGNHEFETLNVIKYCRKQLENIESHLMNYKKIAMVHPPEYKNESNDEKRLQYFNSESEAMNWFLA